MKVGSTRWISRLVVFAAVALGLLVGSCGPRASRIPPLARLASPTVTVEVTATPAAPLYQSSPTPTSLIVASGPATATPPTVAPVATITRVFPSPTPSPLLTHVAIPTAPPRDLIDLQRRLRATATPRPRPTPGPPPDYAVGTTQVFWVANQEQKNYFQMKARLVVETDHAYWYLQDGVSLPSDDLQSAARYFEDHTYRGEHHLFGSEWSPGIDNDVHITILIGHIPGVGGYYSTADEYPIDVNPYSNQREMIYINVDSVRPGAPGFNRTVAHEFMHMIQFNVHRWQDSWVDEGSAELAAQAVTGAASSAVHAFEAQPSTQLNAWASEPVEAVPHYGAAYLFMRYVAEHFGGFQTIGTIIAEPARGIDSFERFFRSAQPPRHFEQVFADWVAANVLDDASLDAGRYGYQGIQLSPAIQPGPTIGARIQGEAHQFGATYYRITPPRDARLELTGAPTIRLIGADPHGAPFEWWSNRGDSIDSRLTRVVDLRGRKTATLRYWIWYDIEQDFDYGYVEVSTDGGQSWRTLPTAHTTRRDPNGQNYGNGYTGTSSGSHPDWVLETVDLSPFAGQQILLRFEYVTDDSYSADGMAIDQVEIPEIGFHDDLRADDGWQAEGFVRIDNRWPETYLLEVLDRSATPPAQQIVVGPGQHASVTLAAGRTVIVAVAGLAPLTTQTGPYVLQLMPN